MSPTVTPDTVVGFWVDAGRRAWFRRDPAFDEAIRSRFETLHHAAARGGFEAWRETPEGALALILVFDQVPRNIYRGSAHAFATDPLGRRVADQAIARGHDRDVDASLQPFFYLPFEHHEDPRSQSRSLALFGDHAERTGAADYLRFARLHARLIERFGRFPHRNEALARVSTPAEIAYLAAGGFKG
jgi:uncharacterized protein (DUF924 family)